MPIDSPTPVSSEKFYQNPVLIVGVSAAVIVIGVAMVVIFKPEWLGGKPLNTTNQYVLTTGPIQENPQSENPQPAGPVTSIVNNTKSVSTPSPVPTPNVGPGPYACDPNGTCNRYNDTSSGSGCPKTFADGLCLNQCSNKAIRCAKF